MRARFFSRLGLVAIVAALLAAPAFATPCDNDKTAEKTADRAMVRAQRQAERAQRIAEQFARRAQVQAEMAAARARWAAEHASEEAQLEAERVQELAERAAEQAEQDAERAARDAERAAERAALAAPGVVVTNDAVLFVDGPEVPRDAMQWADDVRTRRMTRPTTTDTTLNVGRGVTLALANLSGDIVVQVWDRDEVRVSAQHDRSDRLQAEIKDGRLKLSATSRHGTPADVDWNLTVPAWLPLEIRGIESEIAVTGMRARVRAESIRGDVHVSACQGPMELRSTEGEVHAEDVRGDVTAGSINSVVRLVRVRGPIDAQSVNGDIQMDDVSSVNVSASTLNGKVYYASKMQPHGRYSLSSHNGQLYVGVDKTEPVNVTVSSYRGMLESSIPLPPTPPVAPTPPAPPAAQHAMRWSPMKFSLPVQAAVASSPSSASAPSSSSSRKRPRGATYTASAPKAELELESFGGLIQLGSRAEIERLVQLSRAMRDSADAVRRLARLRSMRAPEAPRTPEPPKQDEDDEKN